MSNKTGAKHQKSRKMTVELKKQKPLNSKGFRYLLLWIVIVVYRRLFTDTKLTEDRTQNIRIDINLTRNMPQLAHGFADVHSDEVGGGLAVEACLSAVEGGGGEFEGGVVAGVGDDGFVLDAEVAERELDQFVFEFDNAFAVESTDL